MSNASHGSLGEEAVRLAEAVQEWLHGQNGGSAAGAEASVGVEDDGLASGGAECRTCPACQLLRLVRSTRPEVYAHLADAAASLTAAVRELTRPEAATPPRRDHVEHIDLG